MAPPARGGGDDESSARLEKPLSEGLVLAPVVRRRAGAGGHPRTVRKYRGAMPRRQAGLPRGPFPGARVTPEQMSARAGARRYALARRRVSLRAAVVDGR